MPWPPKSTHGRTGLTALMDRYRDAWMMQMLGREGRIVDSHILTSLHNGTAFFASTSLIAVGGALTLLRSTDGTTWTSVLSAASSVNDVAFGNGRYVATPHWTSTNGTTWTNARSITGGNGGEDDNTGLSAQARYVRINGTARATARGYSLFNFEVYGS